MSGLSSNLSNYRTIESIRVLWKEIDFDEILLGSKVRSKNSKRISKLSKFIYSGL